MDLKSQSESVIFTVRSWFCYDVAFRNMHYVVSNLMCLFSTILQGASGIIYPIIKAEGIRQMFFPVTVPAYHRAPPYN